MDEKAAGYDHSDEVDAEAESGVYMACVFQAGKLGIAAYDSTTAEVRPGLFFLLLSTQLCKP